MARNPEIVTVDPDLGSRAETKRAAQLAHFEVVGEAGYGVEAVTVAKEHTPDAFLVSFEEPVALAVQTIESLADAVPGAPTIVYSSLTDAQSVRRAMLAGARDFIIKPLKPEDLSRAVYGVLEQEERKRLRADGLTSDKAARGTVITVFGAKGGIGKTTISTNLATTLAKITGASVCLLDMDTRFGDVAIMMDVAVEASIADVARRIDEIDRDKIRDYLVKHHSGVSILPAPLHPTEWRNMTPQHIEKIVELWRKRTTTSSSIRRDIQRADCGNARVGEPDPARHQHGHREHQGHSARAGDVARRGRVRGQGEADDQPLDRGQHPARGGRVARAGVRGVLAHSARPQRVQQHPARTADCNSETVRARLPGDYRPGARAHRDTAREARIPGQIPGPFRLMSGIERQTA